jgi:hypothetical protein
METKVISFVPWLIHSSSIFIKKSESYAARQMIKTKNKILASGTLL